MSKIKLTILILCLVISVFLFFLNGPTDFPEGVTFKIEQGDSVRSVSFKLKKENVIRSRTIFEAFVIILGKEKHIISSNYYFETKLSVYEIAKRVAKGEHNMAYISITIPEGFTNLEIANIFSSRLVNFSKENFLAKAKEGYLFPDTYFFLNTDDEEVVFTSMSNNFNKKINILRPLIVALGKNEKDIVIMASLIEKESKGDSDREFISGILWKRLSIGMPLQVDVAPETYKIKGLPSNPIANPGLESLKASISPKTSPYLYYLHDKDGAIHYAKNFTEHRANIEKYLKK